MTILVTGGAGFIGSNFINAWLSLTSEPVVNLDKLTYAARPENVAARTEDGRYRLIEADIADRQAVTDLLRETCPRAVVHLAAETHVDRSIEGPATFVQTNLVGTFNLLECAREFWMGTAPHEQTAFRFVQVSTDEVYGSLRSGDRASVESDPYRPNSPYSASKAGADHLARAYAQTYGLPVIVTNCSNNFGPFQHTEKLIPRTVANALAGLPIPVFGTGENIRDWLHVSDHCLALRKILESGKPGETYNFGGGNEWRNIDLVCHICDILMELSPRPSGHYRDLIAFVRDRPGHDFRYSVNSNKAADELHWRPSTDFSAQIRATVKWNVEYHDRPRAFAAET